MTLSRSTQVQGLGSLLCPNVACSSFAVSARDLLRKGKAIPCRLLIAASVSLMLGGCISLSQPGPGGTLSGKLIVQWAGENKFIYLPDSLDPLTFVTTDNKRIVPRTMYTDGGSIPPIFWSVRGLSPWGYGPAYVVHDWLFEQHRCLYQGWEEITFSDSARILGEVIDTLMKRGDVPPNHEARSLIEQGVRTGVARALWDKQNGCNPPPTGPLRAPGQYRAAPGGPVIMRLDFSSPR